LFEPARHAKLDHPGHEFLAMSTGVIGKVGDFDTPGMERTQRFNDSWEHRLSTIQDTVHIRHDMFDHTDLLPGQNTALSNAPLQVIVANAEPVGKGGEEIGSTPGAAMGECGMRNAEESARYLAPPWCHLP
jgi:hypothetical protein